MPRSWRRFVSEERLLLGISLLALLCLVATFQAPRLCPVRVPAP